MRDKVDNKLLCNILQKGVMTYFNGGSVLDAMIRIKRQEGYKQYNLLLIDEPAAIGWDNLLRGKFTKHHEENTAESVHKQEKNGDGSKKDNQGRKKN